MKRYMIFLAAPPALFFIVRHGLEVNISIYKGLLLKNIQSYVARIHELNSYVKSFTFLNIKFIRPNYSQIFKISENLSLLKISYLIPTLVPSKTNKGGFPHNLPL